MIQSAEVVIVGAGMAGLALAMQVGRSGRSVLVVDSAPAPRDKVCGEGLMPPGMSALGELGLDPARLPGHDFCGLEYRTERQSTFLDFAPGVRGRGIRRTDLINALEAAALSYSGVTLVRDRISGLAWEGARVRGVRGKEAEYRGEVIVAADGVHSGLAHQAGLRMPFRGERMGLRQHFRIVEETPFSRVRVGLWGRYDLYLTPEGPGILLATTMTDRAGFRAAGRAYGDFLRASPYGELFQGARPASRRLGWHHPLLAPRRFEVGGMLLVGDAAGSIDPCLGMGISLAFLTANFAGEAISGILSEPGRRTEWEAAYGRNCRALFQHYRLFDRIFRLMISSRPSAETLVWTMRHWPRTADAVFGIIAERHPWRTFPWSSLADPLGESKRRAPPGERSG